MKRWKHAWEVYRDLPMKNKTILPDEGVPKEQAFFLSLTADHPPFRIWVKPKPKPGVRWGHRVMVICTCGRDIPFGRMNQHFYLHG